MSKARELSEKYYPLPMEVEDMLKAYAAEVERLKENNERLKIALENEQSQFAKRNEENTRLRRVLMNIESAKRLHSGIPWEAMVMTLQDIARQGLKGGEG